MLTQLYIENIAVIEKVSLEFGSGLNVLTGETGAGKSMIIDAIHSVMGERMRRDIVRTGAERALVSAVFEHLSPQVLSALEEKGYVAEEEDTLLLQRTLTADGKSICKINGRPATVSILKEITPLLLNIHGQHESYLLMSPNLHIHYLDQMGDCSKLLLSYQTAYQTMREIRKKVKSLQMNEAEKQDRMDYLRYRIQELEQADLHPGEREQLMQQRTRYANSERILQSLEWIKTLLSGDDRSDGAISMLSQTASSLEDAQTYLPSLASFTERLQGMTYELQDLQEAIRDARNEVAFDPTVMAELENRLDLLYRLSLKYGETEEEMLQCLSSMQEELNSIESAEETLVTWNEAYEKAKQEAISFARTLSQKREQTAIIFAERVQEELRALNMPNIRFTVQQERVPLYEMGCDKVEFLIAANPGEAPKPLAKIASGGELSRIMLAIKTVLSGGDGIDTLIFDEVDTGISGSTAEMVGRKLKQVSENRQVLCVTHLAQIAALADQHYRIFKEVVGERTYTKAEPLEEDGRCRELARIMGGTELTDLMLQTAADLRKRASTLS